MLNINLYHNPLVLSNKQYLTKAVCITKHLGIPLFHHIILFATGHFIFSISHAFLIQSSQCVVRFSQTTEQNKVSMRLG